MRVRSSNNNIKSLECIDSRRNIWRLRWDILEDSFEEVEFRHKPTEEEIRTTITNWYNSQIEDKIINGFVWKGIKIYLSRDNQMNYALFSDSEMTPLTLKLGTEEEPIYHTFNSRLELENFRKSISSHIRSCLQEGWNKKKSIDWSIYK
jgi:hypothetical protein